MKQGDQVFVSFLRAPGPRRETATATVTAAKGDLLDLEIAASPARRLAAAKLSGVPKGPRSHGAYWLEEAPAEDVPAPAAPPKGGRTKK